MLRGIVLALCVVLGAGCGKESRGATQADEYVWATEDVICNACQGEVGRKLTVGTPSFPSCSHVAHDVEVVQRHPDVPWKAFGLRSLVTSEIGGKQVRWKFYCIAEPEAAKGRWKRLEVKEAQ